MTTRYSLPTHLPADDHDRAAEARTLAALLLVVGVIALTVLVGAAVLPAAEPALAAASDAPVAQPLPGA
jgi:hypothetical protein